jgi:broad specificity phosphatase PhoE
VLRDCHQYHSRGHNLQKADVVIVTHGLTLRLFLMRWCVGRRTVTSLVCGDYSLHIV